jgi:flavin reductase (DIM6/NTAB) family NADH-FMN oxidoreductase RutF
MFTIDPQKIKTSEMHSYMLSAIAPRPIAFASTVDREGRPNLSPFSFFNAFGSRPPLVVFSPSRRVRDNTTKHTLENVKEVKEVVINVVNYAMVQQASLASCEYPKGVNEFVKAGFTPVESQLVKPFRVKESPVQMECKVLDIIETGQEGGVADEVLTEDRKIDQEKIDLVARLGAAWYCRASGPALFKVPKPNTKLGIGFDAIPEAIRLSKVLTGNDLGILGNIESLPSPADAEAFRDTPEMKQLLVEEGQRPGSEAVHRLAARLLEEGRTADAWKALMLFI